MRPHKLVPPSAAHPFGTDALGRDILSRVIVAARLDLGMAISAVALSFVVGLWLGAVSGYFGGWTDRIIGRVMDTIMAFPLFVLAMGIVAALGNSVLNIIIATMIINLPFYCRFARGEVNVRREIGYVEAARMGGRRAPAVLIHHIIPNILPPMMVQASLNMGWAILNAAGLSFIGLGRSAAHARMGHHGARGRKLHHLGRVVGLRLPGRGAGRGGVLLQPAGRRAARPARSEEAGVTALLAIADLSLEFRTRHGTVQALEDVSLPLGEGEILGVVGESGSGKSVLAYAVMGLNDAAAACKRAACVFGGLDMLAAESDRTRRHRVAGRSR